MKFFKITISLLIVLLISNIVVHTSYATTSSFRSIEIPYSKYNEPGDPTFNTFWQYEVAENESVIAVHGEVSSGTSTGGPYFRILVDNKEVFRTRVAGVETFSIPIYGQNIKLQGQKTDAYALFFESGTLDCGIELSDEEARDAAQNANSAAQDAKSAAQQAKNKASAAHEDADYIRNTQLPNVENKIDNLDTKVANIESTVNNLQSSDTTPPDVEVETLSGARATSGNSIEAVVDVSDNKSSSFTYSINGGSYSSLPEDGMVSLPVNSSGSNTIKVRVKDEAGNVGSDTIIIRKL